MEGSLTQAKGGVWIPIKAVEFATPKRFNVITVAVLATALLILALFFVYVHQRRKLRTLGARSRRGKGVSVTQQLVVDAELLVDDVRRSRGPRNQPWLLGWLPYWNRPRTLQDASRSFSFQVELERLWIGNNPAVEPVADELVDAGYDDSLPDAAGPRFMATTASGKSLQVVVKTAALASRQPSGQRQQHGAETGSAGRPWQAGALELSGSGPLTGASSRQLATANSHVTVATSASLTLATAQSFGSAALDAIDEPAAPYSPSKPAAGVGRGRGQALRTASKNASARPTASAIISPISGPRLGPSEDAALASSDEGEPVTAEGANTVYHKSHGDAAKAPLGGARESSNVGAELAAAWTVGSHGVTAGHAPGTVDLGVDPAAAWYSRALHRKVSAAAAAAQAGTGLSKMHAA